MSDQPLSLPAKQAALEITALVQRAYGLYIRPEHHLQIADNIEGAITSASDAQVGLLRHVAHILTSAAKEGEGSGAAIVRVVAALRDAGITYEP
jgi:hypothetical protein